jgi:AbrB family looped-hinge helix DNA binding protein
MPLTKVGPRHQITIPLAVRKKVGIEAGDLLEVMAEKGKVVLLPKQMVARAPTPKLSAQEQRLLPSVRKKIGAINRDMLNSKGLTRAEADVAAKVGLIDAGQQYWWLEEWQKGEREAEKDEREGRLSGPFEAANELIAHLHKQRV